MALLKVQKLNLYTRDRQGIGAIVGEPNLSAVPDCKNRVGFSTNLFDIGIAKSLFPLPHP